MNIECRDLRTFQTIDRYWWQEIVAVVENDARHGTGLPRSCYDDQPGFAIPIMLALAGF